MIGCGVVGASVGALVVWGAGAVIAHFSIATAAQSIISGGGASFTTFEKLKQSMGSAGAGMEWHHIVEQCQIDRSGFPVSWVQNSNNVIRITSEIHIQVTRYYNSVQDFTDGMQFRDWLTSMSFVEQYKWGIRILNLNYSPK